MTHEKPYSTDEQRWQAVANRDRGADGVFFYSVRTTGIYCRPTCAARLANRMNVRFHAEAVRRRRLRAFGRAGVVGPNDSSANNLPTAGIERACRLIEVSENLPSLAELAAAAGLSQSHFHRMFKAQLGITPKGFAKARRTLRVQDELMKGRCVTSAMYSAGFGSSSQFYGAAAQSLGMSPAKYRAGGAGMRIHFAIGECWLGSILVAATGVGVCAILLGDDPEELLRDLERRFSRRTRGW